MHRLFGASQRGAALHSSRRSLVTATRSFKAIMAANRGEIATRIFRAGTELNLRTIGVYTQEDGHSLHRFKADECYLVGSNPEFGSNLSPVGKYLNIEELISIANAADADAIHPGYGFLAESADFARACTHAGIKFIGPPASVVQRFGDKTEARKIAIECGVPVIPGSDGPVATFDEAKRFCTEHGYPVMLKAAFGGGGRGMRVVRSEGELESAFNSATSEAAASFGNGAMFIERFIDGGRHIEMQILGDEYGNIVHLYERDCSLQRRHQKVVEVAPAAHLPQDTREAIANYAVQLCKHIGYQNAGTVEFLVDKENRPHFIEVNPRLQVEHTVTEEITGIDIVQSQIRIAEGHSLEDLGLRQSSIAVRGAAIECRVTTEDPDNNFTPDTGIIEAFRTGTGMGIRLDGNGFSGGIVTPHYDSLLVKITAHGRDHQTAAAKLQRSLTEFRVRGVKTNVPFVQEVLRHPDFLEGKIDTNFIAKHLNEMKMAPGQNRAQKLLHYMAELAVNGPLTKLGTDLKAPRNLTPLLPEFGKKTSGKPTAKALETEYTPGRNFKYLLDQEGPEAFAKAVREHKGALLMDTTFRDAHQSLLATRVRTRDLLEIAPACSVALAPCYSMEVWGGATFDVALRFLRECPWERLRQLRKAIPNVPFQMLLRGANAVGYTSYPDNVVYEFCRLARESGIDVFRIFDSLNYTPNMELGIDAVRQANGVVEAAISYTGDVSNPNKTKYNLDYYMRKVEELTKAGIHVLSIKDMAGLLKPNAATLLVSSIRKEYPDLPIHIHTHDTSMAGVASMLAAARAGADVVDVAVDSMSGMTSQPSMGAVVAALEGTELDTGVELSQASDLSTYWETARQMYAPFECTVSMKSGSADVYEHEIPGGQYTNLIFQSHQLGLAEKWSEIKKSYAAANRILGDLVKVTPSSKVVGDLAQWMVTNKVTEEDILEKAESLSLPSSVIDFFQGYLGEPEGGFPAELRAKVLKGKKTVQGRPGASLEPADIEATARDLHVRHHGVNFTETDVMSYLMYPKVFDEYVNFRKEYGNLEPLPTPSYFEPPRIGEEIAVEMQKGKTLLVMLKALGETDPNTGVKEVFFELNGAPRTVHVIDRSVSETLLRRERAKPDVKGSVGAPMPGKVVNVSVKEGQIVEKDAALATLSAMKMETVVSAPCKGKVKRVIALEGDSMTGGDLVVEIEPLSE